MLQSLLSAGSLFRAVGEEQADEGLRVLADVLPDAFLEGELTLANFLHNLLVRLAVEGRHARKQNVSDDTCGPNVTLVVVVLVEHLRSNVVRCAQLLVEVAVRVIDQRGAEVDDLDLVELLVLFEKDVLWF